MIDRQSLTNRRAFLAEIIGGVTVLGGCGSLTYEERLGHTQRYFEYLDRVNTALVPRAIKVEVAEVRVPKPFEQLQLPPPPADDKKPPPPLAPQDDPTRLGFFPNVVLEGVLATWRAKVRLETPGNDNATGNAYLHLLGNMSRWDAKWQNQEIDPLSYHTDIFNALANAFNVEADSPDKAWEWDRVRISSPYVTKLKIDTIDMPTLRNPPVDIALYRHENKDVQVAFVLILPQNLDPREKIKEKFLHTLELLKVEGQIPKKKAGQGAAPAISF